MVKRNRLIFYSFSLVYVLSIILPLIGGPDFNIGDYIFYLSLPCFFVISFACPKKTILLASIIGLMFLFVLGFSNLRGTDYQLAYIVIDSIRFLTAFILFDFIYQKLSRRDYISFLVISIAVLLMNVAAIFFPHFYYEGRYDGVIRNSNMTVYLVSFSIAYAELYIRDWETNPFFKKVLIISSILLLLSFSNLSQSRSFIFPVFYMLFVAGRYYFTKRQVFFLGAITVVFFLYGFNWQSIFAQGYIGRFTSEEISFVSRLNIYIELFNEILANYLLPHGFNSSQFFIDSISMNKDMHAHNDILKYIYNYGFLFIPFIVILFNKIRLIKKNNKTELYLLSLIYITTALHGYLFIFVFLFPFIMVLNRYHSNR